LRGSQTRNAKINGTYQRLTYNQGVTDFNQERYDQAILLFDKSLKFPIDEQIYNSASFYKAEATYGLKRVDEAATLYNQIAKNPKAGIYAKKSLYALGYIYYNQKKYSQALPYFKRVYQQH
jgi:tetratricopeptide (TPR) repeat protein